jgi:hypothetical protein
MRYIISQEYVVYYLTKNELYIISQNIRAILYLTKIVCYITVILTALYITPMSMLTIANKMRPSKTMVGPFPVTAVDDYVRSKLVVEQGVPVTLYEERDGVRCYAVLTPPGKDMRVVCVGCLPTYFRSWYLYKE